MKTKILITFLLFKAQFLFAQQIDIMPYIGPNGNITKVKAQGNTISRYEPASYRTIGAGLGEYTLRYGGGVNVGIILKNNFGFQTGLRYSRLIHEFAYLASKNNEFSMRANYSLATSQIDLPLHLVYDLPLAPGKNSDKPSYKTIRFYAGPVISYCFNPEIRSSVNLGVLGKEGVMVSSYEDEFIRTEWLRGFEVGINFNSFLKDWLSLGLLYQHFTLPVAKVNYDGQVFYENPDNLIEDYFKGTLTAKGSKFMLQIGVKPFVIKKN